MATEMREHEERGHSARYLILIFLVCVATCGVFFSLGFLVGYNERATRSVPATEVVTTPPLVPPTINTPPDSGQAAPQESSAGHPDANSVPETVVVPPGETATSSPAAAKPADTPPPPAPPHATTAPAPSSSAPTAGNVGEGITLQVAALRTRQDAEHLVDILKGRGYPVFLVTPEHAHADDNLFRVQVGPFRTHDDADKMRNKLQQEGFKPFIRH